MSSVFSQKTIRDFVEFTVYAYIEQYDLDAFLFVKRTMLCAILKHNGPPRLCSSLLVLCLSYAQVATGWACGGGHRCIFGGSGFWFSFAVYNQHLQRSNHPLCFIHAQCLCYLLLEKSSHALKIFIRCHLS